MAQIKQDMPPEGGYRPIHFKRIPCKTFFSGAAIIGGYVGMTAGAAYIYYLNYGAVFRRELEVKGGSLAIYPMLLAERDRAFLKQLRRNRDEERELMKNVPGWKVGTWYGEPVFVGPEADKFHNPSISEYYVHSSYKDMKKIVNMQFAV
ncbi:unnamed protein product [Ceutorhynchus assimilis]|uniref:NADH dehydrogenase [ubiquinone] 1 alpha subcomplex subunit 13 n=1 Tax=Ceutorhynchus assimilis TaxID=467358 RepID=A0A9N9QPU9_9CUCU|nr:unnamed protein product [Ceutorhynchus assimilis]